MKVTLTFPASQGQQSKQLKCIRETEMERDTDIERNREREKVRLLSRNETRRKCLSWLPGRGASSVPGMEAGKGTENEQASIRASPAPTTCRSFGLDSGWNTDHRQQRRQKL